MAERVLFNVVGETMKKEIGMLLEVKDERLKLIDSVSTIKAVLLDAEDRQTNSHEEKDWLVKLKQAYYDAEDVLDEFSLDDLHREVMIRDKKANKVCIFLSKSNPVALDLKMAHKIKKVRERLDAIAADRNKFHFLEKLERKTQHVLFNHQIGKRENIPSFVIENEVIGRKDDQKEVKRLLLDQNIEENISFIAIVGMGGIGKTTLARSLYDDKEVSKWFELKMWIGVSEQFDLKIIVEKIIESATDSCPNVREMDSLQRQLQKVIRGKKYLLVMDDIWNESEDKWLSLKNLLMGGARGSKIMFTKRDNILATEIADVTSLYTLKGLSKRDSWSLFKKVAFKKGHEPRNLNMVQLGKEILVKCRGVPLVIRHIGRMLFSKPKEEWMSFANNELLAVIPPGNDMTSILKLSYNHLPLSLKQCFVYSSLFPKDEPINKDELIRQWVAQGFVQQPNGSISMEDTGNKYFMELCWRFFYENIDGLVYMHGVMHDLARMVAGNEYVFGNFKYDFVVDEKTRHVSFDHEIKSWWNVLPKLRKASGLRTFLLPRNNLYGGKNEINEVALEELFSSFPRLRVLSLRYSNIKIVPDSLKNLRHLRYLDLSGNKDMELLPKSVAELQSLQTLNLQECFALKELPRDTSNLVNLRHLDIPHLIHLTHMPKGMGNLTCLQTLSLFVLDNNRHGSNMLSELNGLNDLRGDLHIIGLEQLRSTPSEASLANLKNKKGLRDLLLQWKPRWDKYEAQAAFSDEIVLEGLKPHPNIESLSILGYKGGELPNWVSSPLLKLTHIVIVECNGLQHLPQFDRLPALQYLALKDIRPLKFIDNKNDPSSTSVFFPSLEDLCLENMPNLEGWWKWESTGKTEKHYYSVPTFPRLTSLSISKCPKLAYMPGHPPLKEVKLDGVGLQIMSTMSPTGTSNMPSPFSSLKRLELEGIKDLKYLPRKLLQDLVSLKCLSIKDCENFATSPSNEMQNHTSSKKLAVLIEKVEDALQWKSLRDLDILILENLPKLVALPIGLQHWSSLQRLCISKCSNLLSLPEWIGRLVSLRELEIIKCPKLNSLPKDMRLLKSLYKLRIAGCPKLEARCKEGGEDWPNIAHVLHFSQLLYFFERDEDAIDASTVSGSGEEERGIYQEMADFIGNICSFILTCGDD